jgi:GT2 family glycosyltransferase
VVSVVVPTCDRPEALTLTLAGLCDQTLAGSEYEIVVVDDGSRPLSGIVRSAGPTCTVVRTGGVERSAARDAGARTARGELLVFVDDDITVGRSFLETHVAAHREWPNALAVGAIHLPEEALRRSFGRFREALEQRNVPASRGITASKNFCTAANMSIGRQWFLGLGGFDPELVIAEDQDLALRHSSRGGIIVHLPEAIGIHRDQALDVRTYCMRAEWGTERLVAFCRRHPAWLDNVARDRVNGPVRWRDEPVGLTIRKLVKSVAARRSAEALLFATVSLLERTAPEHPLLTRLYRLLLGIHIFRGYRRGLGRTSGGIRAHQPLRSECHTAPTADLRSPLR